MNIELFRRAYSVFRGIRDAGDEAEAIGAIYYALGRIEDEKQVAFTEGFDQGFGSGEEAARQATATADAFMPGIMRDLDGPDIERALPDYSDVEDIPLFHAVEGFLASEIGWDDDEAREAAADFMRDHWLNKSDLSFSDDVKQEVRDPDHTHAITDLPCAQQLPCDVEPAPSPDFVVTPAGTVFPISDFYNMPLARTVSAFDNPNVRR